MNEYGNFTLEINHHLEVPEPETFLDQQVLAFNVRYVLGFHKARLFVVCLSSLIHSFNKRRFFYLCQALHLKLRKIVIKTNRLTDLVFLL